MIIITKNEQKIMDLQSEIDRLRREDEDPSFVPLSQIKRQIEERYGSYVWFEGLICLGYSKDGDSFMFTPGPEATSKYNPSIVFCISRSFLEQQLKEKNCFK